LQTKVAYKWRAVHKTPAAVFARIYREDERAEEEFSTIVHRQPAPSTVKPDAVSGKEALRNEYLVSVLKEGTHYALGTNTSVMGADGTVKQDVQFEFFQLINTAHGQHRPRRMTATDPDDDVAHNASLALQVVRKGALLPGAAAPAEDPTSRVLVRESDPVWVRPDELGVYDAWYLRLQKWTVAPSEQPGCVVVSKPKIVYNEIPYLDDRCPTLPICWKLKRLGWRGQDRKAVHDSVAVGIFDDAEAVKMKTYYQVLLSLPQCLPLTTKIPSRQPILFYQLLLQGRRVEPDQGNAAYLALWKDLEKRGRVLPALEDPTIDDLPVPLPDGDEGSDIELPFGMEAPSKPKRRKVAALPVGPGGDGTARGSRDPPPPLPPPPDVVPPPWVPVDDGPVVCPPAPPVPQPEDYVEEDVALPMEDEVVVAPPRRADRGIGWTHSFDGTAIRFDPDYVNPVTGVRFSPNWQLKCLIHGSRCIKKKHARKGADRHELYSLAFLHAWLATPPDPGKTHVPTDPKPEAVAAFLDANRDALLEVVRRCVP